MVTSNKHPKGLDIGFMVVLAEASDSITPFAARVLSEKVLKILSMGELMHGLWRISD